jgi:hypothetical protein
MRPLLTTTVAPARINSAAACHVIAVSEALWSIARPDVPTTARPNVPSRHHANPNDCASSADGVSDTTASS